jgi:hypothetical protein
MQFFYDGQVRRYITQVIRVFSNFVVKYGDGSLHRVPVMYGDPDRQVASILRGNSENKVNSIPRIAVYVDSLSMDRDRLADQTFVDKVHIRERDISADTYTQGQGKNYTVERLMPTPFDLKLKVDVWSSSTEQKLQILEQILVLFNPSLELQTNDNYIDWTSLTVLNLMDISWSSRTVPVGNDSGNDIATLKVSTPIWINPPVKVKHLGVITKIITSLYGNAVTSGTYIEGLGSDPMTGTTRFVDLIDTEVTTISNFKIEVYANSVTALAAGAGVYPSEPTTNPAPVRVGNTVDWSQVFNSYSGKYVAGSSSIYLMQSNGTEVIGTIAIDPLDSSILRVNWNPDTLVTNTGIDSTGKIDNMVGYNAAGSNRPNSPGTFDAIINPLTYNPKRPTGKELTDQPIMLGLRFLLVEDIGSADNLVNTEWTGTPGTAATNYSQVWGTLVAKTNDIIEWNGTKWNVIFNSSQFHDTMVWQTNTYTSVQYMWNGITWSKSFEGEYNNGSWRIVL